MTNIIVCNSRRKARLTVDNFWFTEILHISTTGEIMMDEVYHHNDSYKVV